MNETLGGGIKIIYTPYHAIYWGILWFTLPTIYELRGIKIVYTPYHDETLGGDKVQFLFYNVSETSVFMRITLIS